jgi:large subunit ribosomal protein L4
MTEVPVKNLRGEVVGSIELDERVFGLEPNRAVLHQAVVAQLASQRKGSHDTKTRAEVAGGTHKVYRQKGTGRARQGDRRAPHWAGGGIVFGPHPRSYRTAVPRKMRRLAMRSALSTRLAESALTVVEELQVPTPKTREMAGVLRALGLERGALIVVPERDETITRAAANLEGVRTVTPGGLNLLDVLNYRHVVFTRSSAEAVTQMMLAEVKRGDRTHTTDGAGRSAAPEMENAVDASPAPPDVALADAAEQVAKPEGEEA